MRTLKGLALAGPLAAIRWQILIAALAFCVCAAVPAQPPPPEESQQPSPLEIIVLGSGGPAALGRAASSYVVLLDGQPRVLVDAGPGSFARAGEVHISLDELGIVLLTHLHVDHAGELPGFVKARAVSAGRPIHFDVYGPAGQAAQADVAAFPATSRFISLLFGNAGAFAYLKDFSAPITFAVTDLFGTTSDRPNVILTRPGLTISAAPGHHGDAPAVIFRIDYRGHSVVFSGDIDRQGLPALVRLARGANLLVFNSVVLDPPGSPEILYTLHSPPAAIGATAAQSHVGSVLLSHLSPAVEQKRSAVAASIASHYGGKVQFAVDGMRVQP